MTKPARPITHTLDNHPFDLDQVVQLTGRSVVMEASASDNPLRYDPADFEDPFGVIEQIGANRWFHNIEITMSDGVTYYTKDVDDFTVTQWRGEAGLMTAIEEFRAARTTR